jgi:uncharacterized membrane protein
MRLLLTAAAAALALAACKPAGTPAPAEPAPAEPAPSAPIEPKLNGVDLTEDLRVVGTEPFWAVEITNDYLKFSGADMPESTAQNSGPVMTPGLATWTGSTGDGKTLKIELTGENCSDGMSDRQYPLTAKVDLGDQHYKGCAATVAQLSGPPHP